MLSNSACFWLVLGVGLVVFFLFRTFSRRRKRQPVSLVSDRMEFLPLEEGHGELPTEDEPIHVAYKGWVVAGDDRAKQGPPFDQSESFMVVLGKKNVIPCWQKGLRQMRKGAHAVFVCPPHEAYGSQGAGGVIPPQATLLFDVVRKG